MIASAPHPSSNPTAYVWSWSTQAYKAQQDKNRLLKIAILLLGVLFLVICGTMTGLTWAVVDSLKDDDVEDSSAMVARNTEANSQTTSSGASP